MNSTLGQAFGGEPEAPDHRATRHRATLSTVGLVAWSGLLATVAALIEHLTSHHWPRLLAMTGMAMALPAWSWLHRHRVPEAARWMLAATFALVAFWATLNHGELLFQLPACVAAAVLAKSTVALVLERRGPLPENSTLGLKALAMAGALWWLAAERGSWVFAGALWASLIGATATFPLAGMPSRGRALATIAGVGLCVALAWTFPLAAPHWLRVVYPVSVTYTGLVGVAGNLTAELLLRRPRTAHDVAEATAAAESSALGLCAAILTLLLGDATGVWLVTGLGLLAISVLILVMEGLWTRKPSPTGSASLHVLLLGGVSLGSWRSAWAPPDAIFRRSDDVEEGGAWKPTAPDKIVLILGDSFDVPIIPAIRGALLATGVPPDLILVTSTPENDGPHGDAKTTAAAAVEACTRSGATARTATQEAAREWIVRAHRKQGRIPQVAQRLTPQELRGHRELLLGGPPHLAVGAASLLATRPGALLARRALHHLQELVEFASILVTDPPEAPPLGAEAWRILGVRVKGADPSSDPAALVSNAQLSRACRWTLGSLVVKVVSDLPPPPDGKTLGAWHEFLRRLRNRMEHPGVPPEVLEAHTEIGEALLQVCAAVTSALAPLWGRGRMGAILDTGEGYTQSGFLGTITTRALPDAEHTTPGVYWFPAPGETAPPRRFLGPWLDDACGHRDALPADYRVVQRVKGHRAEYRFASMYRTVGDDDARDEDSAQDLQTTGEISADLHGAPQGSVPADAPQAVPSSTRKRGTRAEPAVLPASVGQRSRMLRAAAALIVVCLAGGSLAFALPEASWWRAAGAVPAYWGTLLLGALMSGRFGWPQVWSLSAAALVGAFACHALVAPVSAGAAAVGMIVLLGTLTEHWKEHPPDSGSTRALAVAHLASAAVGVSAWAWAVGLTGWPLYATMGFAILISMRPLPESLQQGGILVGARSLVHRSPVLARFLTWPDLGANILQILGALGAETYLLLARPTGWWPYVAQVGIVVLLALGGAGLRKALGFVGGPTDREARSLDPSSQHDRVLVVFGPLTPFRAVRTLRRRAPDRTQATSYLGTHALGTASGDLHAGAVLLGPVDRSRATPASGEAFLERLATHPGIVPVVAHPDASPVRTVLGALGVGLDAPLDAPVVMDTLDEIPSAIRPLLDWWGSLPGDVLGAMTQDGPPLLARRLRVLAGIHDRSQRIREMLTLFEEHVRVTYCFAAALAGTAAEATDRLGPEPAFGKWASSLREVLPAAAAVSEAGAELRRRLSSPKISASRVDEFRVALGSILGRDVLGKSVGPKTVLAVVESLIALRNALAHRRLDGLERDATALIGLLHGLYMDLTLSSAPLVTPNAGAPLLSAARIARRADAPDLAVRPKGVLGNLGGPDRWHVRVDGLPADIPDGACVLVEEAAGSSRPRFVGRLDPLVRIEPAGGFIDWVILNSARNGRHEHTGWVWAPRLAYARSNPLRARDPWSWPAPDAPPPIRMEDHPSGVSVRDLRRVLDGLAYSASLSKEDRRKILDAADTLDRTQVLALADIFDEEQGRFAELWDDSPEHIEALCRYFLAGRMAWASVLLDPHRDPLERIVELSTEGSASFSAWSGWPEWWVTLASAAITRQRTEEAKLCLARALEVSRDRSAVVAALLRRRPVGGADWLGQWLLDTMENGREVLAHVGAWWSRSATPAHRERALTLLRTYWESAGGDAGSDTEALRSAGSATLDWPSPVVGIMEHALRDGLRLHPESPTHLALLGRSVLEHGGDVQGGERLLTQSIELDGSQPGAWLWLICSKRVQGEAGSTILELVDQAVRATSGAPPLVPELVLAYLVSGQGDAAAEVATTYLESLEGRGGGLEEDAVVALGVCAMAAPDSARHHRRTVEQLTEDQRPGSRSRVPLLLDALRSGDPATIDQLGRELPADLGTELSYWDLGARVLWLSSALPDIRPACARYVAAHLRFADSPRSGAPPAPALRAELEALGSEAPAGPAPCAPNPCVA